MLCLHCGWPRTGTSSLQAVLAAHGDRLAEVGVLYPREWRPGASDAHYGIAELLEPQGSAGREQVGRFLAYLEANRGHTVLLSNEALSNWLSPSKRQALTEFAGAAGEVTQVVCLWTLRRLDQWAESMYLHIIATGRQAPSRADFFAERGAVATEAMTGLRELNDAGDGDTVYLRYAQSGAHNREILRVVGVADPVRAAIEADLRHGPRLNRHPQRKAPLLDTEARMALHAEGLTAARVAGFDPYLEFFGREEPGSATAVGSGEPGLEHHP